VVETWKTTWFALSCRALVFTLHIGPLHFFTNQLHLQKYITADASKSAPGVHIILIMQRLNYGFFLQNKPDILFSTNTNYNFKVFTFSGQPHDLQVH
jgi:hypothetical protein